MLSLAGDLDLTVIAEGIEHVAQADLLVELGCPLGQGFLYAAPQPAPDIDPAATAVVTGPPQARTASPAAGSGGSAPGAEPGPQPMGPRALPGRPPAG